MRLLAGLIIVGVLAVSAGAATHDARIVSRSGLSVSLPSGWRIVDRRLTPCVNPVERLTVRGRGALVMLQEALDAPRFIARFAARPEGFTLRGKPQPIECCAPTRRAGWFFDFRDGGRGFYVYVYLGERGTRAEALGILESLRVRPRSL